MGTCKKNINLLNYFLMMAKELKKNTANSKRFMQVGLYKLY